MKLLLTASGTVYFALLAAYGDLRLGGSPWPRSLTWWPWGAWAALMTSALVAAGVTWNQALRTLRQGKTAAVAQWVAGAILAAASFELFQVKFWIAETRAGLGLARNSQGNPLFGAFFFLLTGFVSLHVIAGIFYSLFVARKIALRHADAATAELAVLYWQFVASLWLITFFLLILPSTFGR
jgi:cytochrome c oxidase subunit 3